MLPVFWVCSQLMSALELWSTPLETMGFFRTCTHKAADFLHLTISKRPKGGGWYLSPPFYGDPWRCDVTVTATISRRFNMTQTRCTPVLHICEASARFVAAACTCELARVEARNSAWSTTKIFSADARRVSDSQVSANSSCQRTSCSSASLGVGVCRRWTSNTMGLNHGNLGDKPKFGYWFQRSRQRILATLSIAEKDGDECVTCLCWVDSTESFCSQIMVFNLKFWDVYTKSIHSCALI